MGLPLVTLDEYKAYAGISSTNQDTIIEALIPSVSELIKSYCRRSFLDYVDEAKVEYFNGGEAYYILKEFPVKAISAVEISTDYGKTYTELTEYSDYVLDLDSDKLIALPYYGGTNKDAVFSKLIMGYKVTYYAGYDELPGDLKLAILDLITYYLKNDGSVHSPKAPGTNSVQIEYITTTALPAHIARVLNLYKASWD